jgi:hypothetical protein
MKSLRRSRPACRSRQSGYALLLAIFLVATLLLFATMATPNVLTQGRREKEQELIWRGNQYVRAIRLFYQKNGRYPQSLDDLRKPSATRVHYLRKPYIEPLNAADGTWRLIYVTPTGQLVGSVRYRNLQEMAVASAMGGQLPSGAAALAAQLFGQPGATSIGAGQLNGTQGAAVGQQQGAQPGQQNNTASAPQSGFSPPGGQLGPGQSGFGPTSSAQPVPMGGLQAAEGPVFGGSVIGVASKIKKSSLLVYQGGKTYFDWEFLWNPLLNANVPGQAAIGAAGVNLSGAPSQPGLTGAPNPAGNPAMPNSPLVPNFGNPGGQAGQPLPNQPQP